MSLFKKPEETNAGVKVLAYGATGVGKTLFSLSFPRCVAIDSEAGMEFYKDNPNLKLLLQTTSADEVEEALEEIEDDLIGEIDSFILDSETKIYENLQHSSLELVEKRAKKKGQDVQDANLSQREWGKIKLINKRIQATKIKLSSMGINIISIAQEKDIKQKRGEEWVVIGHEGDLPKGMSFDYDIVLRLFTEKDKEEIKYFAEVLKDRTSTYKKHTIIENPSYDNWKSKVEHKHTFKTEVIDFKKDIKKDLDAIEQDDNKIEEWKTAINDFIATNKASKNMVALKPLLTKMKQLELSSVNNIEDGDIVKELFDLCE